MHRQLDILALEPFYGGPRKAMLETLIRYSRHRWTLLKLPPRRIERRLAAAAQWFAEQLSRHWVGRTDILFTSEAMNLADLYRLLPALAHKPAVVYFHDNQLPDPGVAGGPENKLDVVNLTTASAATEIWFNSQYHQRAFFDKAAALVDKHEELRGRDPLPALQAKSLFVPPPVDFMVGQEFADQVKRDPLTIFVDTREADVALLNAALGILERRNVKYQLITVGPVEGLHDGLPRITISERDDMGQIQALYAAGVHLSARKRAPADHHAVRALALGCWPVLPKSGVYPELLPPVLHHACLYESSANTLANRLHDITTMERPRGYQQELTAILDQFDAIEGCRGVDQRLEQIAGAAGETG